MLDWLILALVKALKFGILTGLALVTPPDDPHPLGVPGLDTSCHATIILTVHPSEMSSRGGESEIAY